MAAVTVRIRGAGGAEWDVDVPEAGSPARELFDQQLAKGDIVVIDGTLEADDTAGDGEPSKDDLAAQAEALGITVDARWGVARLQKEIAAASGD
jgi:hypothetical protein